LDQHHQEDFGDSTVTVTLDPVRSGLRTSEVLLLWRHTLLVDCPMALLIICVSGPPYSGKSSAIRAFTARYLKYARAKGDVVGVFPMPQLNYTVGVSGSGDDVPGVRWGLNFLRRYRGLKVIIVAAHTRGSVTFQYVSRVAKRRRATLRIVTTKKLIGSRARSAAIGANAKEIRRLMPGRNG